VQGVIAWGCRQNVPVTVWAPGHRLGDAAFDLRKRDTGFRRDVGISAAIDYDGVTMELRFSPELRQQIEAKALSLNLDLNTVVAVLLKLGLRAQD
jgi:hypothetical protein